MPVSGGPDRALSADQGTLGVLHGLPLLRRLFAEADGPFARLLIARYTCLHVLSRFLPWRPETWVRLRGTRYRVRVRNAELYPHLEIVHLGVYSLRPGFEPQPGRLVVDVGANIGVFTILHGRTSSVIAIEPNPDTARRLRANVVANRLPDVTVIESAVGGAAGTAALELNPIASTAARVLPSGTPSTVAVPIRTLDDLLEGDPRSIDLLKIDVEGMEAQVLAGAPLTLPRIRRIVVEYEGNAALADLRGILVPAGFTETYCDTYYVYFERD